MLLVQTPWQHVEPQPAPEASSLLEKGPNKYSSPLGNCITKPQVLENWNHLVPPRTQLTQLYWKGQP